MVFLFWQHFFLLGLVLFSVIMGGQNGPCLARAETAPDRLDETMLMFVGEEEQVVTAASRLPESPAVAPAMVTVVGREEIERHGYQTVAELLAQQPGFFMATGGRGTSSYLRGLRDSVLFLYDGVPVTTDVTKSLAPLDREISLVGIDRVEIVRGSGSVLWGPDAFAGVVNIVPLRGRQRPGLTTGIMAGSEQQREVNVTWGLPRQGGDLFMAATGSQAQYHEPEFTFDEIGGEALREEVDASNYGELVGSINYGDWLHVSSHWSDFTRRYTMQNADGSIRWPGERETPLNQIKASISKGVGPSHYALNGFVQQIDYRVTDAGVEREQSNQATHLEMFWDRRVFARALISVGTSWRRNMVNGAVVRDGFLPDFLEPRELLFVPRVTQKDFDTDLISVFSQLRYQWGRTEWWAGGRFDEHSQYGAMRSYSLGSNYHMSETLRLKTTFGNAFRSPYSSQLFDELEFVPESIRTLSAQLAWEPTVGHILEVTLFRSTLDDHRSEDPYGGLSLPSEQQSEGVELAGRLPLTKALELSAGLTVLGSAGDANQFRTLRFSFVRPDGSEVSVYDEWSEPFEQGPRWLVNLGATYHLFADQTLQLSGRAAGPIDFSYEKGKVTGSYAQPLLLDLTYRRPLFRSGKDTLTFTLTNLLDQNYQVPDLYGPASGPPLQGTVAWQCRF